MSGTDLDLPETMHIEAPHDEGPAEGIHNPREALVAKIAARAEERRQDELTQAGIYDADARAAGLAYPTDEPEPDAPVVVAPEPAAEVVPPAAPAAPVQPAMRAVVVDGTQYAVTEEQYSQLAQLGMVANTALQQMQYAAPQPTVADRRPLVDPERAREFVRKVQYEGEDAAVPALSALIEDVLTRAPAPQAVDQNAVIQQAVRVVRAEAQLAADTAIIKNEYGDILANPQLSMLAKINVDAIRARNAQRGILQSDLDIYREAGNAVFDAIGRSRPGSEAITNSPALQAATITAQPRADVIERKRAAPRTTQVIDRRVASPEISRPPTGSEIVESMRRQRGQASMR